MEAAGVAFFCVIYFVTKTEGQLDDETFLTKKFLPADKLAEVVNKLL